MKRAAVEAWVMQVATTLEELMEKPGTPKGDLGWLHARCTDTIGYAGHSDDLQQASARQLIKDLKAVDAEFPGLLPQELLTRFTSVQEVLDRR